MAGSFDPNTFAVNMPCGDTLTITLNIPDSAYNAVVFAIFNPERGKDILRIPVDIEGNTVVIRLANRHTRDLRAGEYKWQLRFVSDAVFDSSGNVIVDEDSDDVYSYFGTDGAELPDFVLRKDGAYV